MGVAVDKATNINVPISFDTFTTLTNFIETYEDPNTPADEVLSTAV